MGRRNNLEKKYVITVQKIHLPKGIDRKNTLFEKSRNLKSVSKVLSPRL